MPGKGHVKGGGGGLGGRGVREELALVMLGEATGIGLSTRGESFYYFFRPVKDNNKKRYSRVKCALDIYYLLCNQCKRSFSVFV